MRLAARRAMIELDDRDKVQRALDHRTRTTQDFQVGQMVYYWRVRQQRDKEKKGSWLEPARVIGFYDHSKIWIARGNKVLRCSPEQVREMTPDQEAAVRFIPAELLQKPGKFAKRGAQTYLDISREVKPSDDDWKLSIDEPEVKRRRVQVPQDDEEMHDDEAANENESTLPDLPMAEGEINEESDAKRHRQCFRI